MGIGGGLIQLVAQGAQNVHLVDAQQGHKPWRQVYRRQANYAVESIEQVFTGSVAFGSKVSCTVARNGDLLSGLVLEITLKRGQGDNFYPAEHLVKEVVLEIGGTRIDLMTNTWLRLYDELHRSVDAREGYRFMTNFIDEAEGSVKRMYLPLPFWFCTSQGSALPLISLAYHEIKLHFTFEDGDSIPGIDETYEPDIRLWADYTFVDHDERRWLAQNPHRYLIEQTQVARESVQMTTSPSTKVASLPFNHPLKYMAWVLKPNHQSHGIFTSDLSTGLQADEVYGPLAECAIKVNGLDRFAPRAGSFFRLYHPWTTFGQAPSVGVYVYSFGTHPKMLSPTGTLNVSRIDHFALHVTTKAATLATVSAASTEAQTLAAATGLGILEVYGRN